MNRSSKPNFKDVPAEKKSSFTHDASADVNQTHAEGLLNGEFSAEVEGAFSAAGDYLDDCSGQALDDDFGDGYRDDWTPDVEDGFDDDSGDDFEVGFEEEWDDYFRDEFDLGFEDERERRSLAKGNAKAGIHSILERGMVEALAAEKTTDFFAKVIEAIDDATGSSRRNASRSSQSDAVKRRKIRNPRKRARPAEWAS